MTRTYPEEDLLWRHLKTVPAFRALLRAVEARFYRALSIPEPVLDLGCGDGHFAKMIFDSPLAAGVDPWWGPLQKARRAGVYRLNVQAVGDRLPFADQSFGSVISNSVLEHIPDVEPVLRESARVLRPGGQLVVTMPSHLFTEHLGGAALLAPLGLADNYRDFFNTISRHAHTDPPETWAARMGRAGFEVERWQYYFSRRALRALELGHLQGLPSAAIHALTGHWILGPWRDNLALTERWVRPYYEEPFPEEGAYILMVARKVADGAVAAVLPPQEQFTLEQLQAAQPAPEAEEESSFQPEGISDSVVPAPSPAPSPATGASVPVAPPPAALERAPGEPTTRPADGVERADTPPAAEREAAAAGKRPLLPALAILALAVLGQLVLSGQPSTPVAGLWFYGGALALLIASTLLRRRSGDYRLPRPAIRRRTLLFYPPALLLGFLAQRQVGLSLDGGRAALAFLLWFSAIGLALYALWKPTTATEDTPADGAPVTGGRVTTRPPAARRQQLMNLLIPSALFIGALLVRLVALGEHPFVLNGIETSIGLDALAVLRGNITNPFATAWLTNPTLPLYLLAAPLHVLGPTAVGLRILSALVGALTVVVLYFFGRALWGRAVGLVAAILLAGSHFHVHYSRLGLTNIWDALLVLGVLGGIALARQRGTRRAWLLAGVTVGLNAYFYTPSHLLPFMLAGVALYFLLLDRETLWDQGRHLFAAVAVAFVVALPQLLYYNAVPGIFMERATVLGIFQNDWLSRQAAATGLTVPSLLWEQFWQAALAFNYSIDTSSSYNPGVPLLRFWTSVFFMLGIGVAFVRARRLHNSLLLIWLAVTVVFAGALLVDAPDSHRLVVAAPAVHLLAALGVLWLWERLAAGVHHARLRHRAVLLPAVLALLLISGDLFFYFGPYRQEARFGDRNTEIGHEIGSYLQELEGEWSAYFHGPPSMYVDFPTIPFLATEFRPHANLFNVEDPAAPLPDAPPSAGSDRNLVFLYVPERAHEVELTAERFPQGEVLIFEGRYAEPLFVAYEVRR